MHLKIKSAEPARLPGRSSEQTHFLLLPILPERYRWPNKALSQSSRCPRLTPPLYSGAKSTLFKARRSAAACQGEIGLRSHFRPRVYRVRCNGVIYGPSLITSRLANGRDPFYSKMKGLISSFSLSLSLFANIKCSRWELLNRPRYRTALFDLYHAYTGAFLPSFFFRPAIDPRMDGQSAEAV